jgi:hypothetical protein
MRAHRIPVALALTLALATAGCGGSHDSSSSPPQVVSVAKVVSVATPAADPLASLCSNTDYELFIIHRHTVGAVSIGEFKEGLSKLANQGLPVIDSALAKIQNIHGPHVAETKANLERSRRQILSLKRLIARTRSDNFGAFPKGILGRRVGRAEAGCRHITVKRVTFNTTLK